MQIGGMFLTDLCVKLCLERTRVLLELLKIFIVIRCFAISIAANNLLFISALGSTV